MAPPKCISLGFLVLIWLSRCAHSRVLQNQNTPGILDGGRGGRCCSSSYECGTGSAKGRGLSGVCRDGRVSGPYRVTQTHRGYQIAIPWTPFMPGYELVRRGGYGRSWNYPDYGGSWGYPDYGGSEGYPAYGGPWGFPDYGGPWGYPNHGGLPNHPISDGTCDGPRSTHPPFGSPSGCSCDGYEHATQFELEEAKSNEQNLTEEPQAEEKQNGEKKNVQENQPAEEKQDYRPNHEPAAPDDGSEMVGRCHQN